MTLPELNHLQADQAIDALLSCCASRAWAERLIARGPFDSPEALYRAGETVWWQLPRVEWLIAFAAHPRIGERKAARQQKGQGDHWSGEEQAAVWSSEQITRDRLTELNQIYEQRFGHVFLVFASGKTGEEMLGLLEQRLNNDAETELRNAATEQVKITHLRLQRLIGDAA